jgi:chlorophyll/bacteriochlorophyll a synthase
MWAFRCGVESSGLAAQDRWFAIIAGFNSIEGDTRMGIGSLPVLLGADAAGRVACVVMAVPQFVVVALLVLWGRPVHASIVGVLLLGQLALMARLLGNPKERAPWYNGTGILFYVLGMLVSALAVSTLP